MFYLEGDVVKVDDAGMHHKATVIKHEWHGRVWVLLDGHDNPIWFSPDELEPWS
jgi:hypothetical protein